MTVQVNPPMTMIQCDPQTFCDRYESRVCTEMPETDEKGDPVWVCTRWH